MKKLPPTRRRTANGGPRRKAISYALLGASLLLVSAFLVWRLAPQKETSNQQDNLALGAQVYADNCAACHGQDGAGHAEVATAPALDASEHAWHHPDGQLQQLIREGGQVMPPFGESLSNLEIAAVIRYFQTWWLPGQLQSQQSLSSQFPMED